MKSMVFDVALNLPLIFLSKLNLLLKHLGKEGVMDSEELGKAVLQFNVRSLSILVSMFVRDRRPWSRYCVFHVDIQLVQHH